MPAVPDCRPSRKLGAYNCICVALSLAVPLFGARMITLAAPKMNGIDKHNNMWQRWSLKRVDDSRGSLCFTNFSDLPFAPKRHFLVTAPPANSTDRGAHAHRANRTFLQCVAGSVRIAFDNGLGHAETVDLDASRSNEGVVFGPLIWSSLSLSAGTVLLAICSVEYDEADYVRDYDSFIKAVGGRASQAAQGPVAAREVLPPQTPPPLNRLSAPPLPSKVPFLNVKDATLLVKDKIMDSFQKVVESGAYVLGPEVASFESMFASYCGKKHCIGVASGLAALQLMLAATSIGPGDEVIVAANTYIATVLSVSHCGATPVFVEPDLETRNIDPRKVEAAITPGKTKAILTVDLYGKPADYRALKKISDKHGLKLFADAAQSHGAKIDGNPAWQLCDAASFSFYPTKNLGAIGESGAVVTDLPELADRIRALRNYGSKERYVFEERGWNERMGPLQAVILSAKLPLLDELHGKRALTGEAYVHAFAGLDWLQIPKVDSSEVPSWHLFVVVLANSQLRDRFRAHLLDNYGVETLIHYPIPPHLSKAYADLGLPRGTFPLTELLADGSVSLPICPMMSAGERQRVIEAVLAFPETAARAGLELLPFPRRLIC